MGVRKNRKIRTTYLLLVLGFILFCAGSLRLFTKAILLRYGLRAEAQVLELTKRGVANSGIHGTAFMSYEPYARIRYHDRSGKPHTLDIRVPRKHRKTFKPGRRVNVIYNPRFPDYSVKPADQVDSSTWGPDIFLTAAGFLIMGGAIYVARRNYIKFT